MGPEHGALRRAWAHPLVATAGSAALSAVTIHTIARLALEVSVACRSVALLQHADTAGRVAVGHRVTVALHHTRLASVHVADVAETVASRTAVVPVVTGPAGAPTVDVCLGRILRLVLTPGRDALVVGADLIGLTAVNLLRALDTDGFFGAVAGNTRAFGVRQALRESACARDTVGDDAGRARRTRGIAGLASRAGRPTVSPCASLPRLLAEGRVADVSDGVTAHEYAQQDRQDVCYAHHRTRLHGLVEMQKS